MLPLPSLTQLAAAQQANANNPWLKTADQLDQQSPLNAGTINPATGNVTPLGNNTPTDQLPNYTPNGSFAKPANNNPFAAGANVGPEDINPNVKPNSIGGTGTRAPVAIPGLATTGVGRQAESLERAKLKEDQEIADKRSGLLDKDEQSIAKEQAIREIGQSAADDATLKATLAKNVAQADVDTLRRNSMAEAGTRARMLEEERSNLRKQKIDPNHWYKEKGTAGSILAAIAVGAGAFAAAMPHTNTKENFALGIIDKAINRDVAAQQDDMDRKWEDLKFRGDQNEKEFVKSQWMVNQKNEALHNEYSDTLHLVDRQLQSTQNQASVQHLTLLRNELGQKKLDIEQNMADHRFDVSVRERQAAAAAAAANPFSAANLTKSYNAYVEKTLGENAQHPDKAGPVMSREEYMKVKLGQGMAGNAGGEGGKEQAGLQSFDRLFDDLKGDKPGNAGVGNIPGAQYVAPDSAAKAQKYHAIQGELAAGLRSAGEREEPESINKKVAPFVPSPWDTEEMINQKKEGYRNLVQRTMNERGKGPAMKDTSVPGATPVGR